MLKIEGIGKKPGVALAVCAVVDVIRGVNGVSTKLLEKGMNSLNRQLPLSEFPEVIVACDSLGVGMSTRLPGLNTAGVAAESDIDIPGLEPSVPCVIGVKDLTNLVQPEELVIVDGNEGCVYIDPTPSVLIHYQNAMGLFTPSRTITIDSASAPAVTKSGRVVYVFASVMNKEDLDLSEECYPDGYLITDNPDAEFGYGAALRAAAGKPIWFVLRVAQEPFFGAIRKMAAPGQVVAAFALEDFDRGLIAITLAQANSGKPIHYEPAQPWVSIGVQLSSPSNEDIAGVSDVLLDLANRKTGSKLPYKTIETYSRSLGDRFLVALGENLGMMQSVVQAGARCIVVTTNRVAEAKNEIREIE